MARGVPALAAPLLGVALGALLARLARDRTGQVSERVEGAIVTALLGAGVFAPATAYIISLGPAWVWAYAVDPSGLPLIIPVTIALLTAAGPSIGYVGARAALRRRRRRVATLWAALPATLALLPLGVLLRRLAVHASYAQFHGQFGVRPLAGSSLGATILWMAIVCAAGSIWCARTIRRISTSG